MHPDYATVLDNIGNIYLSKGDYDKALEYYFKSIEIRKIVLG
jgi:nephrocystin-3